MTTLVTLGTSFCIGAIIDEAQGAHDEQNYIFKSYSSKARSLVVFKWMMVGFLLTCSYKSVLRAILMKTYYEDTIDTIDDMLDSSRTFMVQSDNLIPWLLASDPRLKVKELARRVHFYKHGTGQSKDLKRIAQG